MKDLSDKQKYLVLLRSIQSIATVFGITAIGLLALVKTGIVIM